MPRGVKTTIVSLLVTLSLMLSLGTGCALTTPPATDLKPLTSGSQAGPDLMSEAWGIIHREYVEKDKVNSGNMSEAAIRGMIEALNDPYSSYLNPRAYQLSRSDLRGQFEGIGAYVGIRDKQLIIVAPMPNSPAARAGLVPGDTILEVDGKPTSAMSLEEAVLHIRGPKGTKVRLLILHRGESEPRVIEIVRASIEIPSLVFEMMEDIAYIRIFQFSELTDEELVPVLRKIESASARGIILDLRSNPGGLLEEVIDIASHFIRQGVIVSVVDNQGKKEATSVRRQPVTTTLPIVALSDNFSASGAEVLLGALQDYGRATVAGTRTYGKGSVSNLFQLRDGSALFITTARWLTPKGRLIEGEGIEPDITLELEGDDLIQWAIDYLKGKK